MKLRHMPAAFRHAPWWVVRHGWRMLSHTFRGSSWRSMVGLDDARTVFARYRELRKREQVYLDWPDPAPAIDPSSIGRSAAAAGPMIVG